MEEEDTGVTETPKSPTRPLKTHNPKSLEGPNRSGVFEKNEKLRNEFKFNSTAGEKNALVEKFLTSCKEQDEKRKMYRGVVLKLYITYRLYLGEKYSKSEIQREMGRIISDRAYSDQFLREILGFSKLSAGNARLHKRTFAMFLSKLLVLELFGGSGPVLEILAGC